MNDIAPIAPRSTFITVLGWALLGLSVLSLFGNLAMASVFWFIDQRVSIEGMIESDAEFAEVPMFARFLISHMIEFALVACVFCLITLTASIGLLKRKDWGRIATILVLALTFVAGIALLGLDIHTTITAPTELPQEVPENMRGFLNAMNTVGMFLAVLKYLAVFLLSGWLIKKLVSEPVRVEFG